MNQPPIASISSVFLGLLMFRAIGTEVVFHSRLESSEQSAPNDFNLNVRNKDQISEHNIY